MGRAALALLLGAVPATADEALDRLLALEGDAEWGAYLASECTGCHATQGGRIPAIEGLERAAFIGALHDYRTGVRENAVMGQIAGRLSDDELAALAAHFAPSD